MFRSIIHPVQMWLLTKGHCVACGMPLSKVKAQKTKKKKFGKKHVCKCGRVYFHLPNNKWRRALQSEI